MRVIQKTGANPGSGCRRGADLLDLTFNFAKIRLLIPTKLVEVPLQSLLGDNERLVGTR